MSTDATATDDFGIRTIQRWAAERKKKARDEEVKRLVDEWFAKVTWGSWAKGERDKAVFDEP